MNKRLALGLLVFAMVACEDSNDDRTRNRSQIGVPSATGTCQELPSPCGGDLVGSWRLTNTCYAMLPACYSRITVTESADIRFTFTTDTLTVSGSGTSVATSLSDRACLGIESCDEASSSVVSCVTKGADCECVASVPVPPSTSYAYTKAGTRLMQLVGETALPVDYCVDGDRLYLVTGSADSVVVASSYERVAN
jgi:hypothetical protein